MDFHLQSGSPVLNTGNPGIIPGVTWMGASFDGIDRDGSLEQ
jgi:hypothetical protein